MDRKIPCVGWRCLAMAAAMSAVPLAASAQLRDDFYVPRRAIFRPADEPSLFFAEAQPIVMADPATGAFRFVQAQSESPVQQPTDIPVAPPSTAAFQQARAPGVSPAEALDPFGGPRFGVQAAPGAAAPEDVGTPAGESITGAMSIAQATTSPGTLLTEANSVTTVTARRRTPVSIEPSIRGYQTNDIYTQADGALWLPVRQDLDTILSKIEPGLIQTVDILPGPYGLRYGPGFAFLNVLTVPTPRYACGPEIHNRFGLTYRPNGDQWYGRDAVYGGNRDWGFIFNYGNRLGVDYDAGNGLNIPASYHNQDFLGQIGWDLSRDSRLEVRYQRLDQTDTEYPAQFFDVNFLGSDAFTVNYIDDNLGDTEVEFRAGGWWNRTRFYGDTTNPSKRRPDFPVINRVDQALRTAIPPYTNFNGYTDGDLTSTGARSTFTVGDEDWALVRVGADFRYIEQHIAERYVLTPILPNPNPPPATILGPEETILTNQPRSYATDPGLFAEAVIPVIDYWQVRIGGRLDWYYTDARGFGFTRDGVRPEGNLAPLARANEGILSQNDELYAGYLVNDVQLTDELTNRFGVGYAERAPTLTERYADGVFLGIIQDGFSRVVGNPALDKAGSLQADWSIQAEYTNFQGRFDLFHAWIFDYITYSANVIADPTGARLLQTTNTDLATLAGGSLYGEYDLASWLAVFASGYYVDGRDREIDAPLSGIAPFQSRFGFRLQDAEGGNLWGFEFAGRIVADQNRLGTLRQLAPDGTIIGTVISESATPGFTTFAVRGYYNPRENVNIIAGIENLFDATYLEHRDLRLPAGNGFGQTLVLAPGFSPYLGLEWTH